MTRNQQLAILYFTNSIVRGGAEEHILELLNGLDRTLFRPLLACPPELAEKVSRDVPDDVELVRVAFSSPAAIKAGFGLAAAIRHRSIDILHSHMFRSSLVASPVGWLCRVPLIIETPHIREQWRRGWKGSYIIDRAVGRCVDYYIAVSHANAHYLTEQKKLPAHKIVVIEPGVDLRRYDPARPVPMGLKRSLGFGDSDPVLLIAGRLEPQKGHEIMLRALPTIRREFPSVRLVCLSEGSLKQELEQKAIALGLADSVRFVGYQRDTLPWLALAELCVLPSFFEGLPAAMIEAQAAGRAVVATAVDGTPEVVIDGKTGFTVPPGDPLTLATAICKLLRDPALRRNFALAGREWVLSRFTRERLLRRTQDLYLSAWPHRDQATIIAEPSSVANP